MISLVIPVRDEADNVAPLVAEIAAALGGEEYEIVFVDDGSTDGTADAVRAAGARLLSHESTRGKAEAWLTGVAAARAPVVVTLDGDGQDDPANVTRLRDALTDDVRLACGCRTNRADGAWRKFCSRIGNGVRRMILRDGAPDSACGLKAFYKHEFLTLPRPRNMHRFLPALYRGKKIAHVPVTQRPRRYGRSKYGVHNRLWASIADMLEVKRLVRRAHVAVEPERTP